MAKIEVHSRFKMFEKVEKAFIFSHPTNDTQNCYLEIRKSGKFNAVSKSLIV